MSGHVSTQADQRATDEQHDLDTSDLARRPVCRVSRQAESTQDVFVDRLAMYNSYGFEVSIGAQGENMQGPIRAYLL